VDRRTHSDPGAAQMIADRGLREARLGTDLTQASTLGVQVGRTLDVHGATVTTVARPA
jgi:hypothetical protein